MRVRDNPLKRIPPTIREKGLQGILGKDRVIECTPHNNFYLIKVASEKDAELLLKQDKLMTTPSDFINVEFAPHNQLSQTKGVLFDRMNELEELSTDDITEALKNQGVVRTDRLPPRATSQNDRRKPGTTYFLTFLREEIPESVKVGCDFFRISEYTPRPRMCRKCLRYGHGTNNCRGKETCLYCHQGDHVADTCPTKNNPEPCYHCKQPGHTAGNPECTEYAYQKQIALVMHQDKLLFWQAKQEVDKSWTKPDADTPTFASVAAAAQPNKENLELKVELAKAKSMNEQLQATIKEQKLNNDQLLKDVADIRASNQQMAKQLRDANKLIRDLQVQIAPLKSQKQNQPTPAKTDSKPNNPPPANIQQRGKGPKIKGVGEGIHTKVSAATPGKANQSATPAKSTSGSRDAPNLKRSAPDTALSPGAVGNSNTTKKLITPKEDKPPPVPETAQKVTNALDTALLSADSDDSIDTSEVMDHNGSQVDLSETLTDPPPGE